MKADINSYTNKLSFDSIKNNEALEKCISKTREDVIKEVENSGLRGRGGAGFLTGTKWKLAAGERASDKIIVCNADEGEPGTFKDRVLINKYCDLMCEGMTIAAYAIGASTGYIYLRNEYAYLTEMIEDTIKKMRRENLLGRNILGKSDFNFDICVKMGAGAYVCGEESALIASMEGFRGEAKDKPPFPVKEGFRKLPTVVNNVETFLWASAICVNGYEWFTKFGTEKSPGLKILSISGDCGKPGVYEVEFGITLNKIVDITEAKNVKAIQVGGAAGLCVPFWEFDRTISYEDLATGGSVIIFNKERDMLEIAENFLEFFCDESCGQCTPCRAGIPKLLDGVKRIKSGKCSVAYLEELIKLADTISIASKCGLGQSAPNVFISVFKNFRDEVFFKYL